MKSMTRSTAHQFRVTLVEIFNYIERQSSRGRNLRLFLETPARRQGVDTERRYLEELRNQHIPERIHSHFGTILVGDGV